MKSLSHEIKMEIAKIIMIAFLKGKSVGINEVLTSRSKDERELIAATECMKIFEENVENK